MDKTGALAPHVVLSVCERPLPAYVYIPVLSIGTCIWIYMYIYVYICIYVSI
jgi:hypothetical protein